MHRISTNDLLTLEPGEGRPTIFTNANARILDRATIHHRSETALVFAEPGRGAPLRAYLHAQHLLQRRRPPARFSRFHPPVRHSRRDSRRHRRDDRAATRPPSHSAEVEIAGVPSVIVRDKPLVSGHWRLIVPDRGRCRRVGRAAGCEHRSDPGRVADVQRAAHLAGRPGVGHELSTGICRWKSACGMK
ncbi:MAG: hypothetical protein M5U34_21435 [Chloroflexi bacterium]|nr:hypothetical protein [Chloroflexota bacterium]